MTRTTEGAQKTTFKDEFDCKSKLCQARQECEVTADHLKAHANCVVCKKAIRQPLIHSDVTPV